MHGSGSLIRWLFDNQLVDEITLLTVPVVVGQGTRLFPGTGPDAALDLVDSRTTPKGGNDPGLPAHRPPAVRNGRADPEPVTWVPHQTTEWFQTRCSRCARAGRVG